MSPDALFWIIVGGLGLTCFASIGARALREFSRHELAEICRRSQRPKLFGEILKLDDYVAQGVESLVVLTTTLMVVAGTFWLASSWSAAPHGAWQAVALDTVLLGIAISAATLWIPWSVVRIWAEPFLFHTWRIWRVAAALMFPLVWWAGILDTLIHRLAGRVREEPSEESLEEEIRTMISEGHREGLLEEDAREMIEGVIELGDAHVSEIMTPRTEILMLRVSLPWDELVKQVVGANHTRIPVFDKNRDDVIGVLHSKNLLSEIVRANGAPPRPVREILRKPYFVPETKAVTDLLQDFQQTRNHMAIVLDEYGGVSGVVTIEDVLEEIVGEIVDEYDDALVEEIKKIDETTSEALGKVHIDEINEWMGLDLPDEGDFDTIAGFVFSELGRIPSGGETLIWQDRVRITVLEATRRRIERVRIEQIAPAAKETA